MTLADLHALRAAGWSNRALARILGRDEGSIRAWLDKGQPMGRIAADWLARVEWVGETARSVTLRVRRPA